MDINLEQKKLYTEASIQQGSQLDIEGNAIMNSEGGSVLETGLTGEQLAEQANSSSSSPSNSPLMLLSISSAHSDSEDLAVVNNLPNDITSTPQEASTVLTSDSQSSATKHVEQVLEPDPAVDVMPIPSDVQEILESIGKTIKQPNSLENRTRLTIEPVNLAWSSPIEGWRFFGIGKFLDSKGKIHQLRMFGIKDSTDLNSAYTVQQRKSPVFSMMNSEINIVLVVDELDEKGNPYFNAKLVSSPINVNINSEGPLNSRIYVASASYEINNQLYGQWKDFIDRGYSDAFNRHSDIESNDTVFNLVNLYNDGKLSLQNINIPLFEELIFPAVLPIIYKHDKVALENLFVAARQLLETKLNAKNITDKLEELAEPQLAPEQQVKQYQFLLKIIKRRSVSNGVLMSKILGLHSELEQYINQQEMILRRAGVCDNFANRIQLIASCRLKELESRIEKSNYMQQDGKAKEEWNNELYEEILSCQKSNRMKKIHFIEVAKAYSTILQTPNSILEAMKSSEELPVVPEQPISNGQRSEDYYEQVREIRRVAMQMQAIMDCSSSSATHVLVDTPVAVISNVVNLPAFEEAVESSPKSSSEGKAMESSLESSPDSRAEGVWEDAQQFVYPSIADDLAKDIQNQNLIQQHIVAPDTV